MRLCQNWYKTNTKCWSAHMQQLLGNKLCLCTMSHNPCATIYFPSFTYLCTHVAAHTCPRCATKFSGEEVLAETWTEHEAAPHQHGCTQQGCGLAFTSPGQLSNHKKKEHNIYQLFVSNFHSALR